MSALPAPKRKVYRVRNLPSHHDRHAVAQLLARCIDGPLLNLTPDIFVRDYVGDTGSSTAGAVSQSPDIIVRQSGVADTQAVFGPGSGNEDNVALSEPVVTGREHSVYVRLQNRGGASASSSRTTMYWSEAATLVTPNLWHEIGRVITPAVPAGRVLTVSPRLPWPATALPPTAGHYCFIALAGTAGDAAPTVPTTFPDFVRFVQANNNAAWRNFNFVAAPPREPAARDFHRFPIRIPGAFDASRRFVLRASGTLPRDAAVRLELPVALPRALHVQQHGWPAKEEGEGVGGNRVVVRLHPFGALEIGAGILPVGSLPACELYIRVPPDTYRRPGSFEFFLSQEWEGVEVGRVTYRFGPVAKGSRD